MMLLMAALPLFATSYAQFSLSSFSAAFISDFGITNTQFSAATLVYCVATGVLGAFGGLLADKYGMRKVMIIMAVISTVSSISRLFVPSFPFFLIMTLLSGALSGAAYGISGKIVSTWFSKKQSGFAFAVLTLIGALGVSVPQLISGSVSSYFPGMLIGGILLGVDGICWIFFGKDKKDDSQKNEEQPIWRYLGKVIKVKEVWMVSAGLAAFSALMFSFTMLMPRTFVLMRGMDISRANSIIGVMNFSAVIGALIIPQIQLRIGKTKLFIIIMASAEVLSVVLMLLVGDGLLLPVVILLGLSMSCIDAFLMSLLTDNKMIGNEVMGSASGFATMIRFAIGGFAVPTFIVTPLTDISPYFLFISLGVLCLVKIIMAAAIRNRRE